MELFTRSYRKQQLYAEDPAYPEPYARVRRVHPSVPSGDRCSSVGQAHGRHHIRRDNDGINQYQRHRVRQRKRLWGAGDYRPIRSGYPRLGPQCDDVIQPYGVGRAAQMGINVLRVRVVDDARDDGAARVTVRVYDRDTVFAVVERPPRDLLKLLRAEHHHSIEATRVAHH